MSKAISPNGAAPFPEAVERYFVHADALLAWVNYEGRHRAGKMKIQPLPKPGALKEPPIGLEPPLAGPPSRSAMYKSGLGAARATAGAKGRPLYVLGQRWTR